MMLIDRHGTIRGPELVGPGGMLTGLTKQVPGDRLGGGNERAPWL
jgi:hypothetical protein